MKALRLKRVYESPEPEDGTRVLVDRLWPRGLARVVAKIDLWAKDAAPSPDLRKWFGHRPDRWEEFARRYHAELAAHPEHLAPIRDLAAHGVVTLLYAARDHDINHAVVLARFLAGSPGRKALPRKP
ncbi:MAG TPA: DUF488 family protein [Acetobacteraceae bacterium]|nr:DUF488 family protein [Acetobacteraceae bacterium]